MSLTSWSNAGSPHDFLLCPFDQLKQFSHFQFDTVESWLDEGVGCCALSLASSSALIDESMKHFHHDRYELGASFVMPNHVHCIVRPLLSGKKDLEDHVGSWKSFSGKQINVVLGRKNEFWQDESYDQIIRDEEHLWNVIQYIGRNPTKTKRSNEDCRLWINPAWKELGWNFLPLS